MYISKFIQQFPIYALLIYTSLHSVNSACNQCQDNGVACINATSYRFCFGATEPHPDQTFSCNDGLVCTKLPIICGQIGAQSASCGDTTTCGQCNKNKVFTCTSRNTFLFCFGSSVPSDVGGICPDNKVCDASKQEICVEAVDDNSIICDREEQE